MAVNLFCMAVMTSDIVNLFFGGKTMKKILLITAMFITTNVFAGYDAWVKNYEGGDWIKYETYSDYGSCERAIKWLYHPGKKCLAN